MNKTKSIRFSRFLRRRGHFILYRIEWPLVTFIEVCVRGNFDASDCNSVNMRSAVHRGESKKFGIARKTDIFDDGRCYATLESVDMTMCSERRLSRLNTEHIHIVTAFRGGNEEGAGGIKRQSTNGMCVGFKMSDRLESEDINDTYNPRNTL